MEETRKNNTLAWESSQGLGSFLLRDLALQRVAESARKTSTPTRVVSLP